MARDGRIDLLPSPPEEMGTWEGARWLAIRAGAAMTFRERLEWNEEMLELAERFRISREKMREKAQSAATEPHKGDGDGGDSQGPVSA